MGVRQDILAAVAKLSGAPVRSRAAKASPIARWTKGEVHKRDAAKFRKDGNPQLASAHDQFAREAQRGLIDPVRGIVAGSAVGAAGIGAVATGELTRPKRNRR